MKCCSTCRYWQSDADGTAEPVKAYGRCHRNAPHPVYVPTAIPPKALVDKCVFWPKTTHVDACGQHRWRRTT
jgi:hypothetical protein